MKKNIEIRIHGEEVITHYQVISVEVPANATVAEIEEITSRYLEDAAVESNWEIEDSTGVIGTHIGVEVVGELGPNKSVCCRLRRDQHENLVLQTT